VDNITCYSTTVLPDHYRREKIHIKCTAHTERVTFLSSLHAAQRFVGALG
jgi:hypothetical protein